MRILSVDVGTRHFAMTLYCTEDREFKLMRILDLRNVKDYVAHMKLMSEEEPFKSADVVLVERQMRSIMKTMATAIRAFNFEKTLIVSPQSVKHYFRTSTKNHRTNKQLAMCEAPKLLTGDNLVEFNKLKKKDDIADCVLQTYWYMKNRMKCRPMKKQTRKVRLLRLYWRRD